MTKRVPPYPPEVRARAVRLVLDQQGEHGSQWAAIHAIAAKIGCSGETLRHWVRQAERERGVRAGPTRAEHERIKALEREVRERLFAPRLRVASYEELNAWLLDQCIAGARADRHPEQSDQTIWQVFEAERAQLVPIARPFDGFRAMQAAVSKTCLVRFDNIKYSVSARAVGRPVEIQAYVSPRALLRRSARTNFTCLHMPAPSGARSWRSGLPLFWRRWTKRRLCKGCGHRHITYALPHNSRTMTRCASDRLSDARRGRGSWIGQTAPMSSESQARFRAPGW
jgi:transposase-like protein